MPELHERDLSKLFQAAGHHAPERDHTAQIMARVAVTPLHRPAPAKPLIGRTGWVLIAGVLALPFLAGLFAAPAKDTISGPLAPVWEGLAQLQLPAGPWPAWMIGASVVALLLVGLDSYLSRRTVAKA